MFMKIYKKNVNLLTDEEYGLLRKDTFGASDVASLMGVGFSTAEDVIAQKKQKFLTEEEKAIGKKPNVRKGKELENFILDKYRAKYQIKAIEKPAHMYEIWEGLTVNFDAILDLAIPVEVKYVSTFGHKAYKTDVELHEYKPNLKFNTSLQEYLSQNAALAGIPVYYYTQLQTQMLALESEVGLLIALFEKDWELRVYKVYRDPHFKLALKLAHSDAWNKLNASTNTSSNV